MKSVVNFKNPYLLFFPFLIAFILFVFISPTDGLSGDQPRYLECATNLLHGYYSPAKPNIQLINGPGYPIILMPFVALKLPLMSITIMNAFFYYFSIIFQYKALNEIFSFGFSLFFSLVWACYFVAYPHIPYIATETFTYLLISLFIYYTIKAYKQISYKSSKKYVFLSGFIFGYIVLTKMIFGYVLLFMLVGCGLLWIFYKNNLNYRKGLIIVLFAFLTTSPYLAYTYHLTGRLFYWGMGGDSLFWMSTPYEGEYGDWTSSLSKNPTISANFNIQGADSVLRAHHQADYNEINKYTGLDRDDAFKRLAMRNIKSHPIKFAQNIIHNIGRLIFHYPFSHAIQKPKNLLIFPINGILLTLIIFSIIPTIYNWTKIPFQLKFILIIAFLYLGASAIATAFVRMFTIVVPIIIIWIAYVIQNTIKITFKFKDNSNLGNNNRLDVGKG